MIKNIVINTSKNLILIDDQEIEIVERKGVGHPDTISDSIAEEISVEYSRYCLENFGCILRHMVDKISVTGGLTKVSFGGGKFISPAKVRLNGRFTESVGDVEIPYMEIAEGVIYRYFENVYFNFKREYIVIENNTHSSPGPGIIFDENGNSKNERKGFFIEQTVDTIKYHNNSQRSNDTSTAVCYFPISNLEKIVIETEKYLNSKEYKNSYPYVGTDIKVMGIRNKKDIEITICLPLISSFVTDYNDYMNKIDTVTKSLKEFLTTKGFDSSIKIFINTRDRSNHDDLYMTLLGSALESGDEGSVGRGNRIHGVIPFTRNITMEASCGKNPVYHIGKIYTSLAYVISRDIYNNFNIENIVFITSQIGRDLSDPWLLSIELKSESDEEIRTKIKDLTNLHLKNISSITNMIIKKEIPLHY